MTYFEKQYKRFKKPIFRLFKLTYEGLENIPKDTGFIVCANHTAMYDAIVIIASMGMPVKYMAKAELFKVPGFRKLISNFGAYPVKRGATDVTALKKTVEYLKNGDAVGMFPQGTRMPYVKLEPSQAKSGLGLTAYRASVPILPVYIKTKKGKVKLFSETKVIIGKPISPEELGFTDGTMKEINRASQYAFGKVCEMQEANK